MIARRRSLLLALPLLTVLLVAGHAEPRSGFRLEGRVPASTLAFASLEDVGSWQARLGQTALGRLLEDEEMKAFVAPLQQGLEGAGQEVLSQVPPVVLALLEQLQGLQGQVAIALVGMDMDRELPQLVASLDFGDHVQDFVTFLRGALQEMDPEGQTVRAEERDGRPWWTVDAGPFPIRATISDTTLVLATDEGLLAQVLAGGREGSLEQSPEFAAVARAVGGADRMVSVYANVAAALSTFADALPEEVSGIGSALGLDTVQALGYGCAFKGDGFQDTLVVHAPGADHGLLPLLRMKPLLRPTSLDLVPASALVWSEANLPFGGLLDRLRTLLLRIDADTVQKLNRGLAEVRRAVGVDVENELLAGLDDQVAFSLGLPDSGGLFPELAIMLRLRDPAAFEPVFERFATGLAGAISEEEDIVASTRTMAYHGVTMHLFEMQNARGDDPVPFTPTWAIVKGHLVLTVVPYTMKEVVLRSTEGALDGGLAGRDDFRALLAVKPERAGAMTYVDTKSILTALYGTAVPVLQMLVKPNMLREVPFRLDWAQLPPARRVAPHLTSLGCWVTWDDEGIGVAMQSPIPALPILAAAGAAAAFFAVRSGSSGDVRWVEAEPMPGFAHDGASEMDQELARLQAQMLADVAAHFQAVKGHVPQSLDDLVAAELLDALPRDPWGQEYKLYAKGGSVVVVSPGPDGALGTDDDVRSGED